VNFVLSRHQGLDVRSLLQQDLVLLRALCLAPVASRSAVVLSAISGAVASVVDKKTATALGNDEKAKAEAEADVVSMVATTGRAVAAEAKVSECWRVHVGVLLRVLGGIPTAADDSLAVVEHAALPCLEVLAALCLDGVFYPEMRGESPGLSVYGIATAAAAGGGVEERDEMGGRLDDALLKEVLRACDESRDPLESSVTAGAARGGLDGSSGSVGGSGVTGGGGGGDGVGWTTLSQTRSANARARLAAAPPATNNVLLLDTGSAANESAEALGQVSALTSAWDGGAGVAAVAGLRGGGGRPSRFPQHWLLRLVTCRQSFVLRRFSGMVLGELAVSRGPEGCKEVAEVAAHLLGLVGADGEEAAALQALNLLGRLCSTRKGEGTQEYMEGRGLRGFLAAAVLQEARRLQSESNTAAQPPPPFSWRPRSPPTAPRSGELFLRLADALQGLDATTPASSPSGREGAAAAAAAAAAFAAPSLGATAGEASPFA
ncbi:unnamed protein product, partial [Laminaria digitata]